MVNQKHKFNEELKPIEEEDHDKIDGMDRSQSIVNININNNENEQ